MVYWMCSLFVDKKTMSQDTQFSLTPFSSEVNQAVREALAYTKTQYFKSVSAWALLTDLIESSEDVQQRLKELNSQGVNVGSLLERIKEERGNQPRNEDIFSISTPTISQETFNILSSAQTFFERRTGRSASAGEITAQDILHSFIENQNYVQNIFIRANLTDEKWKTIKSQWYPEYFGASGSTTETGIEKGGSLDQYCENLTEKARLGLLDPIVGRGDEVREAMNILQRRTQNNPVFVGEAGVGKTALVSGLAQRMAKNEVPETMKGKQLLSLDLIGLTAGAGPSEVEKRVKGLIKELNENPNVLLFIDDIHHLVSSSGSAYAVGQMLKPALARGELRCIGATTPEDYRIHIEKDVALERRFQKVMVEEPSIEEAVGILRGLKETYALHHGVDITDSAIYAAVELSSRYVKDRCLPSKAIDLMDGAAARVCTTLDSKPENLDRLERNLMEWKVQRESIKQEEMRSGELDLDTVDRLEALENQIQDAEQQAMEVEQQWNEERELHNTMNHVREEIAQKRAELQQAEASSSLVKMSELQHGVLPDLNKQLRAARQAIANVANPLLHDQVEPDQIAAALSQRTGIPVAKMTGNEQQKLADMESILGSEVIGQAEAVEAIADAVRRNRAGLSDANKPIGSFMFLGPTGVGKTELTKQLSNFLFEDPNAMVRVDMSEYMEKHNVARLIGPPPGYVGYEEGGMLTEAVRARPYSVVLFDEVEKAHADVFNILLQVLDDGHLTDNRGRKVDFKNTVIIMTSNLGSANIQDLKAANASKEEIKESVNESLKSFFRPEFLNRLDEKVIFNPLEKDSIALIAQLQIKKLIKNLKKKRIDVTITPEALEHLVDIGFDPLMGARPLKRAIQQEVENPLSKKILMGDVSQGDKLTINTAEGNLTWNVERSVVNDVDNEVDESPTVSASSVATKATKRRKASTTAPKRVSV